MRRSESNLIKRRGSYESPSSRLRRALSLTSAAPVGRRRSDPPPVHCRSSNILGQELQNKHMPRLRSAQSLALRSSRSSRSSRDSLLGSAPSHHQRHLFVCGGPNAVFDTIIDKRSPIKSSPTTGSSPYYARINLRYKNDCGRAVAIATARAVHHDIK